MPYIDPPTAVAGYPLPAADWNNKVRDSIRALRSPPICRVYHSAVVGIPNVVLTAIGFNSERWDTDTIHEGVVNPTRLTAKTAGFYNIFGHGEWAANVNGHRRMIIRLNGAYYLAADSKAAAIGGNTTEHSISTVYYLAVNDYVELVAYQSSGAMLNLLVGAASQAEFGMNLVAA